MTADDLLKTLEAEGVGVSLNLKVSADAKPSDDTRALIRNNRDALLEHLARTRYPVAGGLHLYGDLLHSLMVWVARYYEFRLEHPGGINLDAKPDHVTGALTRYPWGVVYTAERYVLLAWGDVPRHTLTDKTELQATAQTPVPAERVVN